LRAKLQALTVSVHIATTASYFPRKYRKTLEIKKNLDNLKKKTKQKYEL